MLELLLFKTDLTIRKEWPFSLVTATKDRQFIRYGRHWRRCYSQCFGNEEELEGDGPSVIRPSTSSTIEWDYNTPALSPFKEHNRLKPLISFSQHVLFFVGDDVMVLICYNQHLCRQTRCTFW